MDNTIVLVLAAGGCLVVVACVVLVLILYNKGGGGGAYAGLPSDPPTYSDPKVQALANVLFAHKSECWDFNHLMRVVAIQELVDRVDALVTQWKAANPGKPWPTTNAQLARSPLLKSLSEVIVQGTYGFMQAASKVQCDANATFTDDNGRTRKIADYLGGVMGKNLATFTPAQLKAVANKLYPAALRII